MKLLVVEDNPVTATLMTNALSRNGYTVVQARNGSDALSLLGSEPDIAGVITDIIMPEASGLDLIRTLKNHAVWRNLPIIVTTARDDRETVKQAASLGCKQYILKPVRPAVLMERVAKVFPREKVVLMNAQDVVNRYALSSEAYLTIAKDFTAQVDKTIEALQLPPARGATRPAVDLVPIMETATLLGAERLVAILEDVGVATDSPKSKRLGTASLLEELELVRKALRSQLA
jgi:CheY-like chemotaxis protein